MVGMFCSLKCTVLSQQPHLPIYSKKDIFNQDNHQMISTAFIILVWINKLVKADMEIYLLSFLRLQGRVSIHKYSGYATPQNNLNNFVREWEKRINNKKNADWDNCSITRVSFHIIALINKNIILKMYPKFGFIRHGQSLHNQKSE